MSAFEQDGVAPLSVKLGDPLPDPDGPISRRTIQRNTGAVSGKIEVCSTVNGEHAHHIQEDHELRCPVIGFGQTVTLEL